MDDRDTVYDRDPLFGKYRARCAVVASKLLTPNGVAIGIDGRVIVSTVCYIYLYYYLLLFIIALLL